MINPTRKAKLQWQCRRGMLELDLLLNRVIEKQLNKMTDTQITAFEGLLDCNDPELYSWLMDYEQPKDKELAEIVEYLKLHSNS